MIAIGMIWYSVVFIFAIIGMISLIMSYEYMRRFGLILSAISILLAIGAFIHMGVSKESVGEVVYDVLPPLVTENWLLFILAGVGLTIALLYSDGVIHWIWRRVHPQSAPTDDIGIIQGGTYRSTMPSMSSALMGTSTAMFNVQELDVKTIALIRLALVAFAKVDRTVVAGIERKLKLGDGRRYKAFHQLVADSQTCRQGIKDIVHPYLRAINGNHASARNMFTALCQLARDTRNTDKKTVNRLLKIGQSLGLSPENMGLAINQLRA